MSEAAAFLLNSLNVGGSEVKTVHLLNALHAKGWPVHLLYLNEPNHLGDRLASDLRATCLERSGKLSLSAARRLRAYVAEHSIGTILAVNLYPQLYAAAACFLSGTGKVRNLVSINTSEHLNLRSQLSMLLYGPVLKRADSVIFGSVLQRRMWVGKYGLEEGKCEVIYNGVDVRKFLACDYGKVGASFRQQLGFSKDDLVIGTVGRLQPEKNHVHLILAIHKLRPRVPSIKALIVGDGDQRDPLVALANSLGLREDVIFSGRLDDVRPALAAMDIFVLPSVAVENFSNAALEAMAMSRPVILADIGGAREMIEDKFDGYVHAKGQLESLISCIEDLATDVAKRENFGRRARSRVVREFSLESVVGEYERVLGFS